MKHTSLKQLPLKSSPKALLRWIPNAVWNLGVLAALILTYWIGTARAEAPAPGKSPGKGEVLSLDGYLTQVSESNVNLKSSREASVGAELRTAEADLLYMPRFFAEAQWLNDHETNALFTIYQKYRQDTYALGFQVLTPYGLQGKLAYTLMNVDYVGLKPRFWEGQPRIELSQSLWRNFFGNETRAQEELIEAGARATRYSQSFNVKRIRAEAETAYIRVAAAQGYVDLSEQSMKRAKELLDWSTRRTRLNLGEDSDLYQAQANFESRKLLLEQTRDALRTASRNFNRLRNRDSDDLDEKLILPELLSLKSPERALVRDDVQAAIEQARVTSANARLGAEKNKPILEVYGSYALNSRTASKGTAVQESFHANMPTSAWGLRFSTPVAFGKVADSIEGYKKEAVAADALKDQRLFEQEVEWKDLVQRFDEAKRRYEIAKELAEIQRKKMTNERVRLTRGRTTTYQALTFEIDFIQAESSRIQAQSDVLEVLAQMKTFGG